MKSLEAFYQSDLLPDLEKLETRRLTAKKKFIQAIMIVVVLNLVFLFVAGNFGLNLIFWLMFLVLSGIFVFFSWHIKYFRGYHAGFKETIIPKIVSFIDQNLQYDKAGVVPKEEFMASHLFVDKPGDFHGDDLVSGVLGQTAIQFSEIHAKRLDLIRQSSTSSSTSQRTRKKYTPIFNGLFFVADFNKSFKGTTIVLPDTAQRMFGDLGQTLQALNVQKGQLIKLEDPEFEKLFVVYGQDQTEARYVLSTSLMRRIVEFQNRVQKKIRFSFSASKLYVAIPYEKELFEPKLMQSLLNISHVQDYYDDLKLVTDIVEELNLNTRIWTQKGQTTPIVSATAGLAPDFTQDGGTVSPLSPMQGKPEQLSADETREAFKGFVDKADTSMAPRIKTVKRWLKRIAGIFLLLLCLPFLFFGSYMAGLIILGFGLFFCVGGFVNATIEKLAGAALFTGIGIVIALFSYSSYQTSVESKNWPTVDGVIIMSEIQQRTSTGSEDTNNKTEVRSYPKVTYQYQVGKENYESTKISFSVSSGSASQIISQYPKGKTVRVYYNPDNFNQAVLIPGSSSHNYVPYVFAIVFILLGVGMAIQMRKQFLN